MYHLCLLCLFTLELSFTLLSEAKMPPPTDKPDSISVTLSKDELDKMIQTAVAGVVETTSKFLMTKIEAQNKVIQGLQARVVEVENYANRLEQYTRRCNLRIHGLRADGRESYKEAVAKFISSKLKDKDGNAVTVSASDLDAAHPLPPRQVASGASSGPLPKPKDQLIAKFHSRELRDKVLIARRSLAGSGIAITEDLTQRNANRLKQVKDQEDVESAWVWLGSLYVKKSNQARGVKTSW